MEDYFSADQIFNAYKKLKHYFYYDNTTLYVKDKIAEFENEYFHKTKNLSISDIKAILKTRVLNAIEELEKESDLKIKAYALPKKIKRQKLDMVTTNNKAEEEILLERLNIYIDAPVEIHVLSVLWVMYCGRFLVKEIDDVNYANKLTLDINNESKEPEENLKLFKPYFIQYQDWRDSAIKKAESLLDERKNVTILSLDIKDYYHSVRLNLDVINYYTEEGINKELKFWKEQEKEKLKHQSSFLNKLLGLIHKVYYGDLQKTYHFEDNKLIVERKEYPLPIGLVSSGLLGNFFLKDLDENINENLNPAFYGRYVDDLMFVFSDLNSHTKSGFTSSTISFINRNFVRKGILDFEFSKDDELPKKVFFKEKNDDLQYIDDRDCINKKLLDSLVNKTLKISGNLIIQDLLGRIKFNILNNSQEACGIKKYKFDYEHLTIQSSKVVLHYFNHKESRAVLNIFKKKLEEQRSEFRFLPDEDEISDKFDEEAFSLNYNDSVNKFRSIQDFSENKYGASKFLAKKIFARSFGDKEEDKETDKQILTFFKESTALSFYSLWEKVATYFIICERPDHLVNFKRNIEFAINKCDTKEEALKDSIEGVKKSLMGFLDLSISIPFALNPKLKLEFLNEEETFYFEKIKEKSIVFRKSNLFRHSLVSVPTINYTNLGYSKMSFLENDYNKYIQTTKTGDEALKNNRTDNHNSIETYDFSINPVFAYLAPNYIPFHEVNILRIVEVITSLNLEKLGNEIEVENYNEQTYKEEKTKLTRSALSN